MAHPDASQRAGGSRQWTITELFALFLQVWLVVALAASFVIARPAYCQRTVAIMDPTLKARATAEAVSAITKHEHELQFITAGVGAVLALCACGGVICITRLRRSDGQPYSDSPTDSGT